MRKRNRRESRIPRPRKPPDEKLVTLSVRVPRASLDLLNRVIEGEREFLRRRNQPTRGVTRSAAFRTIWEMGELEFLLQRATLWVTRKTNRYSVDRAARLLDWDPDDLARVLAERGIRADREAVKAAPADKPDFDPRFLV